MSKSMELVANRYIKALMETGKDLNCLDEIHAELHFIGEILDENPNLKAFLSNPTVSINEKKETVEEIFKKYVKEYMINFLLILIDKNRLFLIDEIIKGYDKALNKQKNIEIATVTTAIDLDEDSREKLKSKLESIMEKKLVFNIKVNPDIIGGVVIKIEDKLIDGSIKTKLEEIKKTLIRG